MMDIAQAKNTINRLFVAGIPSGVSLEDLSAFFNKLGPFTIDIHEFKARCLTGRSKGYVIVHTADKLASEQLLFKGYIQYKDRTLSIMPFYSGPDLKEVNRKLNQKRVILKRVPSSVTQAEIVSTIERKWGRIQSFFQYNRVSKKSGGSGKFKSYSLTLEDPIVASNLVKQRSLSLTEGQTAQVIPYDVDFLKGKNSATTLTTTTFTPSPLSETKTGSLKNKKNQGKANNKPNTNPNMVLPERSQPVLDAGEAIGHTRNPKARHEMNSFTTKLQNTNYDGQTKYNIVPMVQSTLSNEHDSFEVHFLKPVSTRYHIISLDRREAMSLNEIGDLRYPSNERFNIATKPHIVNSRFL